MSPHMRHHCCAMGLAAEHCSSAYETPPTVVQPSGWVRKTVAGIWQCDRGSLFTAIKEKRCTPVGSADELPLASELDTVTELMYHTLQVHLQYLAVAETTVCIAAILTLLWS
mmetsp:Transcript_9300/g.16772  ORF Transcript_9300/g.16772 Transcript_9300/m.16772 type:complete len:112 (-) Transcript_9300:168-503(-)